MSETKETKELVVGFLKLAGLMAESFKDGVQVADLATIFQKIQADPMLSKAIQDAYSDVEKIPAEIKEMGLAEAAEILVVALPEIVALLKAVKK